MYFVYLYVKPVKDTVGSVGEEEANERVNERMKSPEQHGKSCTIRKENQFPLSK